MLQKDLLGQDMFLIGRPGPLRRQIAMQFLEMTNRELEYVSLSRDTTEADLKQRREIKNGTASYFDQVIIFTYPLDRLCLIMSDSFVFMFYKSLFRKTNFAK